MIDPRPDRGIPDDQWVIQIHDGRIVSAANDIDDRMAQAGTWLLNRDLSDGFRSQWIGWPQRVKCEEPEGDVGLLLARGTRRLSLIREGVVERFPLVFGS